VPRLGYVLLALLGGGLLAVQAPINARLRVVLATPLGSALVSFVVGTALLFVVTLLAGDGRRTAVGLGSGPWWAYLGGACGIVFVVASLVAVTRIGVTTTFVAVTLGQVAVAAIVDRFGWFGISARPVSAGRLAAIGLLVLSLALLARD
jgi:transporter family-2 protein